MSTALRFTLAEYDRMIEQGVLNGRGDLRTELIYGEKGKIADYWIVNLQD